MLLLDDTFTDIKMFLYRDVLLFWELSLSKNQSNICNLKLNQPLSRFTRSNPPQLSINIGDQNLVQQNQPIENRTIFLKNVEGTIVAGTIQAMRNSIAHGNYIITRRGAVFYIEFIFLGKGNLYRGKGKIDFNTLVNFISILKAENN